MLVRRAVSPNLISVVGVVCAGGAGLALAFTPAPVAAIPVTLLLIARLACANLDGTVARETQRSTRFGAVLNEAGDRAADLLVLAGLLPHVPLPLVAGAALASSVPSWIALSGAAAGAPRINGGPMGKTERCLVAVLAAATGWYSTAAVVVLAGSLLTGALRLSRIAVHCGREPSVDQP
ncbi:CDP-alcohol phosphatidyltransferase family protein [Amycolatopsis suaedae]|uniref:CDP-alcohol phosphatidyltransferase family protein n=1 Tax=Amycolatopsis suaedae TaxID=2510978 RepID=UPI00196B948A|nr:CDP-alcohol phosphatidyltransferase family protein [Amycolatopsis suaedae]